MRYLFIAGLLAAIAVSTLATAAEAKAAHGRHSPANSHRSYLRSLGPESLYYGRRGHISRPRPPRYVELAGDPYSGFGFYPLPPDVRYRAWRYHLRHPRPLWANPVYFAIMADAARYYYDIIPANQGWRYGVFDPIEGVGTPFFGGFYGPE
jgi:hypothetical protein